MVTNSSICVVEVHFYVATFRICWVSLSSQIVTRHTFDARVILGLSTFSNGVILFNVS